MISPIIIATVITVAIGIGFSIFPCGPDKALCRTLAITCLSCLWLMWLCAYLSQINPLISPELS